LADKAIESGSVAALLKLFDASAQADIQMRFNDVISRQGFNVRDVEAGREYVKAYITFMHHVEHVYEESEHKTEGQ